MPSVMPFDGNNTMAIINVKVTFR